MLFRAAILSVLALSLAACSNAGAPVSPTGTPTGSIALPTAPPIDVPSSVPSSLPSVPAGADACALVTAAELQTVFGAPATAVSDESGECTITATGEMIPIVVRHGVDETIDAAKMIVDNGQDLTVGGNRAFYGELMGGILYVEKNGRTLVLQAPLNTEARDTLIRVAEFALPRF